MNWKTLTALLLLLPIYAWMGCVLPPIGVIEFVTHMAEAGEHCYSFCQHPSPPVDHPPESAALDPFFDQQAPLPAPLVLLPHRWVLQDRPPPLFHSLSHSLRAPPSLIDC